VRHRRAAQPNFHYRALGSYTAGILQAAEYHRQQWLASGPQFQDFNKMSSLLSLDIVARTLFGANLNSQLNELHQAWDGAMNFILARTCAHRFVFP
jgi:cytochrome P450